MKTAIRGKTLLCCVLLCCGLLAGCMGTGSAKIPITLTVWHVYGGQTDSPLNNLIEEFNQTVGKEQGINLVVTSVSNTNTIHEVLSAYIPAFLQEGVVDGRLVVFPVAKSTEILFVNKTLFDRFAAATGASLEQLRTWEGLLETAVQYADWTDAQTPDKSGDGKIFFAHDYPFNYFQVGVISLAADFFNDGIADNSVFEQVWQPAARAAVHGGLWLEEGYATDPIRTGEAIASVASSASVLYYKDIVTYPDNTSEKVEIISFPCPVFANGENLVMQRGAGFCTVKSTPEREKAACVFLKWLTEPACNTRFVCTAGYLPVTYRAFDEYLAPQMETMTDPMYISLYKAILETQEQYAFYTPPQLQQYLFLEESFSSNWRYLMSLARHAYKAAQEQEADTAQLDALEQELSETYRAELLNTVNGSGHG